MEEICNEIKGNNYGKMQNSNCDIHCNFKINNKKKLTFSVIKIFLLLLIILCNFTARLHSLYLNQLQYE